MKYKLEDVKYIDFECQILKSLLGTLAVGIFEKMNMEGVTENKRRTLLDNFIALCMHLVKTLANDVDDLRKLKMFFKNLQNIQDMNFEINAKADSKVLAKSVKFTSSEDIIEDDCINCDPTDTPGSKVKGRATMAIKQVVKKETLEESLFVN